MNNVLRVLLNLFYANSRSVLFATVKIFSIKVSNPESS